MALEFKCIHANPSGEDFQEVDLDQFSLPFELQIQSIFLEFNAAFQLKPIFNEQGILYKENNNLDRRAHFSSVAL